MTINGTAGNDNLVGTSGNDSFNLSQGGDDTVQGLDGKDLFVFGATLTAADSIDGGAGADVLRLNGDYSAGLVLGAATVVNVEKFQLDAGHGYNITTNDATVAAHTFLSVDASALTAANTLIFNGIAESDGRFIVTAGAGDDNVTGGAGADQFDMSLGGNDTVSGRGGNDIVSMGAALTASDRIDGGGGNDVVQLDGDYTGSHAVTFATGTLSNVEKLTMAAGHSYNITTADATVGAHVAFTVDASALGSGDALTFDGEAESNGNFHIIGGAGNDVLTGGNAGDTFTGDTFDLSKGGNDIVNGGDASDTVTMGAALNAADAIDGGGGGDFVVLDGDYSGANALVLSGTTLNEVDTLMLQEGFDYDITTANGNVAAGDVLNVNVDEGAGHTVIFNGAAETDGTFVFTAGLGTDTLTGGGKNDSFTGMGGLDTFHGGAGNDNFREYATSMATDQIDGGAGTDTLQLISVPFVAVTPVTFGANALTSVEIIDFASPADVTSVDANVAAGQTLTVSAREIPDRTAGVTFDGSAETDGHFLFLNNLDADTFIGGALSDTFDLTHRAGDNVTGGGGADLFESSLGANHEITTFNYNAVSDSTSTGYDTITGGNYDRSVFHTSGIGGATTGVDPFIDTGSLSTATFDSDLASAVGAAGLAAHHAVLFTPDSGTLSGDTFLIIDENGVAGYQAGADLVIGIGTMSGTLTTANFT